MTAPSLNPFIFGKPVPTGRFIGRQNEVRALFSRLHNGESTAIVGDPHIGKTSLLSYIADEDTRREWIAQAFAQHVFVDFDCDLMPSDFHPADFWARAVSEIAAHAADDAVARQCHLVIENHYGSFTLEGLFRLLAKREWRAVLLIDEFDKLLNHPHFATAEFLGALRSLATRTDGLVVITASRLSVAQMNRLSTRNNPYGSPFFNNMIEVRLPHLTEAEAERLIDTTLKRSGGGVVFNAADRAFVYGLAGRHPFLLQVASASLYDAYVDGPSSMAPARAETLFRERSAAHFDDLARALEANTADVIRDADRVDRMALRQKLVEAFSLDELQQICFDLGVDYEDLGSEGKSATAVKLILYCQRSGRTRQLIEICRALRPEAAW